MRTGIWIPLWIENLKLTNSQKKLLAEIVSLHQRGKCFASNQYFSEVLGLKPDTISGMISFLKKKGFIRQTGFDGRKRYLEPASDSSPTQKQMQQTEMRPSIPKKSEPASDFNRSPFNSTLETIYKSTSELNLFEDKIKSFSQETKQKLLQLFESRGADSRIFESDDRIFKIWTRIMPSSGMYCKT